MDYDVIIVGGGPAGLSAALVLGRCRRAVLLCDAGEPRNAEARALHGFLSRDGIPPTELLRIGREQLGTYPNVELRDLLVVDGRRRDEGGFEIVLADGARHTSRKLLLATGVADELPDVDGIREFYGRSVFHCPYCDGWEMRDAPLAVYGDGASAVQFALELTCWSRDLVLCTDGPANLEEAHRERLAALDIAVKEEEIRRLEGKNGQLERVVFEDGPPLPRRGLFFNSYHRQRSHLPEHFGCTLNHHGAVETGAYELTHVEGLYVAGDASRSVQLAIVAASEGAKAAFAINTALLKEDLR